MFVWQRDVTLTVKSCSRLRLKCDGTHAETTFCLSAKRTSPFKSAGASVQSTAGRRAVHTSLQGLYCSCKPVFYGHVTLTGYPLHSLVFPSLLHPCVTVCHHIPMDSISEDRIWRREIWWRNLRGVSIGISEMQVFWDCTVSVLTPAFRRNIFGVIQASWSTWRLASHEYAGSMSFRNVGQYTSIDTEWLPGVLLLHAIGKQVKCTLVQALRLCTGRTAHRGSRGIALLFRDQRH